MVDWRIHRDRRVHGRILLDFSRSLAVTAQMCGPHGRRRGTSCQIDATST